MFCFLFPVQVPTFLACLSHGRPPTRSLPCPNSSSRRRRRLPTPPSPALNIKGKGSLKVNGSPADGFGLSSRSEDCVGGSTSQEAPLENTQETTNNAESPLAPATELSESESPSIETPVIEVQSSDEAPLEEPHAVRLSFHLHV